jgi:hydrogenase nickel incorporation protein HypB
MAMPPRIVEVRANVLKKNDLFARELRERFRAAGVLVISLVSSPGAGKTTLLERTLAMMAPRARVAALVGDLQTDNDARRLASTGVPVRQITTGTVCHLDAEMVGHALDEWAREGRPIEGCDVLFIENVGNLVCPASYDLGEALRVVLLSVTEGEDKPLKYPTIFNSADVAVITKIDLADVVGFDRDAAYRAIDGVCPRDWHPGSRALTRPGPSRWRGGGPPKMNSCQTCRTILLSSDASGEECQR